MRISLALVVAIMLIAASCSSGADSKDSSDSSDSVQPTDPTAASTAGAAPTTEPTAIEAPTTAPSAELAISTPRAAFDLVLAWMNGADVDEGDYTTVFAEVFVTSVPFANFQALAVEIAAEGPWTLATTLGEDASGGAYEVTSAAGEASVVQLEIDAAQRQITSLLVQPKSEFSPPADQAEAISRLEQLGNLRLAVLDATAGSCTSLVDAGVLEVMPLGSAFKLYVLGAVSAAVGEGTIGWDTLVTIDDALDSLPSGTTQNIEPGTEVSVQELAEGMISISDNTATDHLIHLVGRAAVEDALVTMGNDAVERNTPFLTTRDLFILKYGADGFGDQFLAADEAGRRALLDGPVAAADLPTLADFDPATPNRIEQLEWFASPHAMCQAMSVLVDDPVALEILSLNPGLPDASGRWTTIAFKGGSEPGLIATVWWVQDADGKTFVVAGSVVNDSGPLDEFETVSLLAYLRDNVDLPR